MCIQCGQCGYVGPREPGQSNGGKQEQKERKKLLCFITHLYSPILGKFFIVLLVPTNKTCASLVLLA